VLTPENLTELMELANHELDSLAQSKISEIDDSSVVEGEEAETTRVSFSIIIHTITKQD